MGVELLTVHDIDNTNSLIKNLEISLIPLTHILFHGQYHSQD